MIKIALCVKQVPDTTDIRWTSDNTIQREGVESVINPYDVYALELALNLKRKTYDEVQITAFTMAPPQAEPMLRKLLALGCDDAVLVSDKKFSGADTYATATTLSTAIKKVLPDADLIICGQFATDGDTAQTGPNIATMLGLSQVTFVKEFLGYNERKIILKRELDEGYEIVSAELPAVVCVLQNDFEPTRAKINNIIEASQKEIKSLGIWDLELTPFKVGIKGSPTTVTKAFRNIKKHETEMHFESAKDSAKLILNTINAQLEDKRDDY